MIILQLKIADFYNISAGNVKKLVHGSIMRTYNFIGGCK